MSTVCAVPEHGKKAYSVNIIVLRISAAGFKYCRENIRCNVSPVNCAGLYFIAPGQDCRDAYTSLKKAEFMSLEFAGCASVIRVLGAVKPVSAFTRGTVVALKINKRVVKEPELLKLVGYFPNSVVYGANHSRHYPSVPRQVGEAFKIFVRCVHRVMRCIVRNVQKERLVLVPVNKINAFSCYSLGQIFSVGVNLIAVFPEVVSGV